MDLDLVTIHNHAIGIPIVQELLALRACEICEGVTAEEKLARTNEVMANNWRTAKKSSRGPAQKQSFKTNWRRSHNAQIDGYTSNTGDERLKIMGT